VAAALLSGACKFEHGVICTEIEAMPNTPLLSQTASIVINAPDLQVVHGSGCARRSTATTSRREK
jgi:hypothetical protein